MEALSLLTPKLLQRIVDFVRVEKSLWVLYPDVIFAFDLVPSSFCAQRRYTFQSPLRMRQALKQSVAICCDLLLPTGLFLLPGEPEVGASRGHLIQERGLFSLLQIPTLTIDEALSGRNWQKEKAHRKLGLKSLQIFSPSKLRCKGMSTGLAFFFETKSMAMLGASKNLSSANFVFSQTINHQVSLNYELYL